MGNNQTFGGSVLSMVQGIMGTFLGMAFCAALVGACGIAIICGCLFTWSAGVESVNADRTATAQARVAPVINVEATDAP